MSTTAKMALKMMMDPDLAFKEWPTVIRDQKLNFDEEVDGEQYCAAVYVQWVYANLAALIGAGDDVELARFIETVDPTGSIQQRATGRAFNPPPKRTA